MTDGDKQITEDIVKNLTGAAIGISVLIENTDTEDMETRSQLMQQRSNLQSIIGEFTVKIALSDIPSE